MTRTRGPVSHRALGNSYSSSSAVPSMAKCRRLTCAPKKSFFYKKEFRDGTVLAHTAADLSQDAGPSGFIAKDHGCCGWLVPAVR